MTKLYIIEKFTRFWIYWNNNEILRTIFDRSVLIFYLTDHLVTIWQHDILQIFPLLSYYFYSKKSHSSSTWRVLFVWYILASISLASNRGQQVLELRQYWYQIRAMWSGNTLIIYEHVYQGQGQFRLMTWPPNDSSNLFKLSSIYSIVAQNDLDLHGQRIVFADSFYMAHISQCLTMYLADDRHVDMCQFMSTLLTPVRGYFVRYTKRPAHHQEEDEWYIFQNKNC